MNQLITVLTDISAAAFLLLGVFTAEFATWRFVA